MNEVAAIIELPVLMLHCPKCKWRFPVKLPAFASATKEGKYISCAACGSDFSVRVELLARDAQLRIGADDAGQGMASPTEDVDGSRSLIEL